MSIRLRLTLLYSMILALTLIILGVVLYAVVAQVTFHAAQDALQSQASSLIAAKHIRVDEGGALRIVVPAGSVATAQTYAQVRALDGTVADQSPELQAAQYTLPLDQATQTQVLQGTSVTSTISVDGRRLLLYSTPITFNDQLIGILQMARSLQEQDQALSTLRRVLLLGGALVTGLACLVGWLLSRAALRPITRITQTAQAIGEAQDFNRRVSYTGPQDEVGKLATTFNTMLARLQGAYQAQRRFVADASHELRTPLTSIRGNLGLLEREPPISPEDRAAVMADLVSSSERVNRLVNDLLTLARADAGRPLRREPVRVGPLLAGLSRQLAVVYPDRALLVECPQEVAVYCDPDALSQVLLNLLDNALKFTPAGGTVSVAMAMRDEDVAIAVRDNGPGIAPEQLPHVFERFYQADAARAGKGAGLGLAIARTLVQGQGGTLRVESSLGHGSTFTVLLPPASHAGEEPTSTQGAAMAALQGPASCS